MMWPFNREKKYVIRLPACLEFPSLEDGTPTYVRGEVVAVQPYVGHDDRSVLLFDGGQHVVVGCGVEESRNRLGWRIIGSDTL